jgi:hypothetical protein
MTGKRKRLGYLVALGLVLSGALAVPSWAQQPDPEKARTEKKIVSYGQPDDWANWDEIWQVFPSPCARGSRRPIRERDGTRSRMGQGP